MFLQEKVPGWLYQVKNGATTIWERWDAIKEDGSIFDPAMNSYNHYAYGAVCQWLFEAAAGFRPDPDRPGFKHIVLEPVIIAELAPVKAHYRSASGPVSVEWSLNGDRVSYDASVPSGATATLILSARYQDAAADGTSIQPGADGVSRHELAAGRHEITFRIRRP